tara:strand:+ start:103 stop:390 length:288 start_codon:yes stop_codon:yes gene_type:complete
MEANDNVVDLTPKAEKITASQLEKVQKAVSDINRAQMEVGRVETQKHMMMHEVVKLQEVLKEIQDELEKDYGTVNINIEDGVIKYPEDEQADKKD